jgi:sec-independent protein translocase protein TatA
MELLGVGLPELAFIILIALILLGPKDMMAAGRTIGRTLRAFLTSPTWQAMRHTGEELQKLPTKLVREAGLEELQALQQEVQSEVKQVQGEVKEAVNQIQPPDLGKVFDERQIFNPPTPVSPPDPNPETPPGPPSAPEA